MKEGKLRKLIELFQDSDIGELEVQHSFWHGTRIRLSKGYTTEPSAVPTAPTESAPAIPVEPTPPKPASVEEQVEEQEDGLHELLSPMVGTFYRAASPEASPFVREGSTIDNGQTVCIIEAMKIMNEIPAEIGGEVVEFLVDNAQPVEYNQPLLKIRPS